MKIKRDGKVYELTPQELYEAYEEQTLLFNIEHIVENLSEFLDKEEDCKALENNPEALKQAANSYRDLKADGFCNDVALRMAIQGQVHPERKPY